MVMVVVLTRLLSKATRIFNVRVSPGHRCRIENAGLTVFACRKTQIDIQNGYRIRCLSRRAIVRTCLGARLTVRKVEERTTRENGRKPHIVVLKIDHPAIAQVLIGCTIQSKHVPVCIRLSITGMYPISIIGIAL